MPSGKICDIVSEWKSKIIQIGYGELFLLDAEQQLYEYKCICGNQVHKKRYLLVSYLSSPEKLCCKDCVQKKKIENNMKKYGVRCTLQLPKVKEKSKQTMLKRYGADSPSKIPEFVSKQRKTMKERYGHEFPLQAQILKEKQRQTVQNLYGVDNVFQALEIKDKGKQTMKERFGYENAMQVPEIREKSKQTLKERYNVENCMQIPEVREKAKTTIMQRYGETNCMRNSEVKEKFKKTMNQRYECNYTLQSQKLKDKQRSTMKERYGSEFSLQVPEILEKQQKSSFCLKSYMLNNNEIFVQGYEPYCLDDLINDENIEESDILSGFKSVPSVTYVDPNDNKQRKYFPDIYIKSQNKVIEVKSIYTLAIDPEIIKAKLKACKDFGFEVELRVYDKDGNCVMKLDENLLDIIK